MPSVSSNQPLTRCRLSRYDLAEAREMAVGQWQPWGDGAPRNPASQPPKLLNLPTANVRVCPRQARHCRQAQAQARARAQANRHSGVRPGLRDKKRGRQVTDHRYSKSDDYTPGGIATESVDCAMVDAQPGGWEEGDHFFLQMTHRTVLDDSSSLALCIEEARKGSIPSRDAVGTWKRRDSHQSSRSWTSDTPVRLEIGPSSLLNDCRFPTCETRLPRAV
ncbi:hypothetical protein F4780DRAFT_558627 [Xylariomycetidae sp. FL0641]|nr:hypothetical protein F4780DRAFT_558627 [Xylariomycetidae sp. FL0641]